MADYAVTTIFCDNGDIIYSIDKLYAFVSKTNYELKECTLEGYDGNYFTKYTPFDIPRTKTFTYNGAEYMSMGCAQAYEVGGHLVGLHDIQSVLCYPTSIAPIRRLELEQMRDSLHIQKYKTKKQKIFLTLEPNSHWYIKQYKKWEPIDFIYNAGGCCFHIVGVNELQYMRPQQLFCKIGAIAHSFIAYDTDYTHDDYTAVLQINTGNAPIGAAIVYNSGRDPIKISPKYHFIGNTGVLYISGFNTMRAIPDSILFECDSIVCYIMRVDEQFVVVNNDTNEYVDMAAVTLIPEPGTFEPIKDIRQRGDSDAYVDSRKMQLLGRYLFRFSLFTVKYMFKNEDVYYIILYDYDDDAITIKAAEYTSSGKKTKPALCAAD